MTVSAGAIGWLVGTESGLRFGLYKIPSCFGGLPRLVVQGAAGGFEAAQQAVAYMKFKLNK